MMETNAPRKHPKLHGGYRPIADCRTTVQILNRRISRHKSIRNKFRRELDSCLTIEGKLVCSERIEDETHIISTLKGQREFEKHGKAIPFREIIGDIQVGTDKD